MTLALALGAAGFVLGFLVGALVQLSARVKALHEQTETLTRVSERAQALRTGVTGDVTAKQALVTRPLNATAKVTGYTETGEPFPVPQDGSSPRTEP